MKEVKPRTITGTLSWYKISPLRGYNLFRAKQKLRRRRRRVYESFSSRRKSQKSFIVTNHWTLENPVKTYHVESLYVYTLSLRNKRNCRTSCTLNKKREHQLYYCHRDWMISGGWFLWNAITICEMSKTS